MITLNNISLNRGVKTLLENTSLTIYAGQKIGLVGRNGCGKSSLFAALQDPELFSGGSYDINQKISTAHIAQEMPNVEINAIEYAARGDAAYADLMDQLDRATAQSDDQAIVEIHHQMSVIHAYAIPAQAAKILIGLGFTQETIEQPVNTFSGGWRMRLNLARVLLSNADLLLLDEPTNHLDLEAIVWLENWLVQAITTIVVISHDRQFLDNTVTRVVHVEHQKLQSYSGNYSEFETRRAEQLALQSAAFARQEKRREDLQSFVDRFRAKASKAKQAQSRLKMLEKLDATAPLRTQGCVSFEFLPTTSPGNPMMSVRDVALGYAQDHPVLEQVTFSLRNQDRIGLIGPNGAGKSTFIKFLAGKLKPLHGQCEDQGKIKVGYFAQHLLDQLDVKSHALQILMREHQGLNDTQARKILGRYQFGAEDIVRPISSLSGGERARLVLALIIQQAPNLLLLDEPTNHLDLEVRDALNMALQNFSGATVVVSHDRFFLSSVSDQLWLVYGGKVQPFNDSLEAYQQWYQAQKKQETKALSMKTEERSHSKPTHSKPSKSEQVNLKELQKQLAKNETLLEKQLQALAALDQDMLSHSDNYERLQALAEKRRALQEKIDPLETEILSLMEKLGH